MTDKERAIEFLKELDNLEDKYKCIVYDTGIFIEIDYIEHDIYDFLTSKNGDV